MAVITLIAAPAGADVPGIDLATIDVPVLDHPAVTRWVDEQSPLCVWAAGHGDRIPHELSTLDVPVSDEEYQTYLDAVAKEKTDG